MKNSKDICTKCSNNFNHFAFNSLPCKETQFNLLLPCVNLLELIWEQEICTPPTLILLDLINFGCLPLYENQFETPAFEGSIWKWQNGGIAITMAPVLSYIPTKKLFCLANQQFCFFTNREEIRINQKGDGVGNKRRRNLQMGTECRQMKMKTNLHNTWTLYQNLRVLFLQIIQTSTCIPAASKVQVAICIQGARDIWSLRDMTMIEGDIYNHHLTIPTLAT